MTEVQASRATFSYICDGKSWEITWSPFSLNLIVAALGVQQPSLLGASPTIYTQQTALAAAGLTTQTPANYQLTQTAALQQQAAAVLQQVSFKVMYEVIK